MPELPEVEYTARQLRETIVGATIQAVEVFWPRTIGHPTVPDFVAEASGRRIESVRRRGKFLLLDLSGELLMTIHRRMTGNLLLLAPGWRLDTSLRETDPVTWRTTGPTFHLSSSLEHSYSQESPPVAGGHEVRYCRVSFVLGDGRCLVFTDPRKFGRVELWSRTQEELAFRGLGPEPLGEDFTVERLQVGLRQHRTGVKQALLNQEVVAGVGNIYADEALFYARIHPSRRTDTLTTAEIQLLHEGVVTVLTQGIEHGGTSFNDYRDLWGEAGNNYNHVSVYHQEGKPCRRCGTMIERIVVAQRGTHFCPTCQALSLASSGGVAIQA